MSTTNDENSNENPCVVCFKDVDIYSIGICNHPVCSECSTRMRVLCLQNECPICRQDMPKVIFTKSITPFTELEAMFAKTNLQDRKFGVLFTTSEIQKAYYNILEHQCNVCEESDRKWPFRTFQQLQDHMRREHQLYYCEICVENLKIFTFERRCYSRQELAHHRRKGDLDNTSHRGHPLCEFCDKRYIDNDDLFRHLRREHFYCHFCDADGKNQYYMTMEDLCRHFDEEHYMCKEGDCRTNPLTAVFKTDIDLKAHIAFEHSRNMSKAATKQARTLELEFSLAPRPRADIRSRLNDARRDRMEREIEEMERLARNVEVCDTTTFNASSAQDFPALGGNNATTTLTRTVHHTGKAGKSSSKFSQDDFPTLGGNKPVTAATTTQSKPMSSFPALRKPTSSIASTTRASTANTKATVVQSKASKSLKPTSVSKPQKHNNFESLDDFPALATCKSNGSTTTVRVNTPNLIVPKVSVVPVSQHQNNTRSSRSDSFNNVQDMAESFPTLGKPLKVTKPQWVQEKGKKKSEHKKKSAPTPELPPSNIEQFPSLENKSSKPKSALQSNGTVKNSNSSNSSKVKAVDKNVETKKTDKPSKKNKKKNGTVLESIDSREIKITPTLETAITNYNNIVANSDNDKKPPPDITKPPPGFNVKPPPGFDNLTFPSLNSASSITEYHHPQNFQNRNIKLIKKVMAIADDDKMSAFKTFTDAFRNNALSGTEYYKCCKNVLGDSFEEIFPELLVLLPDVPKQQELYKIYSNSANKNLLVRCEKCKQVVFTIELSEHYSYHALENMFPSLASTQVDTVWRK